MLIKALGKKGTTSTILPNIIEVQYQNKQYGEQAEKNKVVVYSAIYTVVNNSDDNHTISKDNEELFWERKTHIPK